MSPEIRVLGPWEFRGSDGGVVVLPRRLKLVVTALALAADQAVGVDALAGRLWPQHPPSGARALVHTYIGRLRKQLGAGVIDTQPGCGYRLSVGAIDLRTFRGLLAKARTAGSADEELTLLRAALLLWRGTPFADLSSAWLDREVLPRLTDEWFTATARRIELELADGHHATLTAELWDLAGRFPTRELVWQQLITALYRSGRRADALNAYQQMCASLRDELGIEPGGALVRLYQEIICGDYAESANKCV